MRGRESIVVMREWTKEEACAHLKTGYWFGSTPAELQQKIMERATLATVPAGTMLYRIGEQVDGLYALLEGDVRAYVFGDEGERIFISAFGPKSWIGDFHLLDGYPLRTYEVQAASQSTLLFLSHADYRRIAEEHPDHYKSFVELVCIHARSAARTIVEQRSQAPLRAARALLRLARAHGKPVGKSVELQMNLSQSDLASLVGVSRQYLNGLLSGWQREGIVKWAGRSRPLLDIERLKKLLSPLDSWMPEFAAAGASNVQVAMHSNQAEREPEMLQTDTALES
jgi:CRP-like cAMP-binding protein